MQRCEPQEITANKASNEFHLYWKKYFPRNPFCFRIYADFEANNEVDNSRIAKKETNIYQQIPVCFGYYIVTETNGLLQSA